MLFFLLWAPDSGRGAAALRQELIRVAICKGVDSARVDGSGVLFTDDGGMPLRMTPPLQLRRYRDGISVNGQVLRRLVASAPATVIVNGKGYRGVVEFVPGDKGILAVNELPLEEYLIGLINCEMSSQWPMEAIKSQAVIARSYALYQKDARKNSPYHLESSVMDQVYDGCDIEDSRAARAVRETAGEVLTYNGTIIQAFYHSNCGGHTEAVENVWGFGLPYLKGVDCSYCLTSPSGRWEQAIPLAKVESQLKGSGYQISGLRQVTAGLRNKSGRLTELVLTGARSRVTVPAVAFRKALGYSVIKSTNFEVRMSGDDVLFAGAGYGHGVGLCQWGAKQRAADGFDYREILAYYYPGTTLESASK